MKLLLLLLLALFALAALQVFLLYTCRPDMTFAVDWALNNNYLSFYLLYTLVMLLVQTAVDSVLSSMQWLHQLLRQQHQ